MFSLKKENKESELLELPLAICAQAAFQGIFSCFISRGTESLGLLYCWIFQDCSWPLIFSAFPIVIFYGS